MSGSEEDDGRIKRTRRTLRSGFTTGACAAAAAKAAAIALHEQKPVSFVNITLPQGQTVSFDIVRCQFDEHRASCSVIKDAGDDPDVTHGAEIGATVEWNAESRGITICGGEGVGVVTKPGLELPIGSAAINPVPRQMIAGSVQQAVGPEPRSGLKVTVYVPRGKELAKKTLNGRLGIIGGISILGTTGIVTPYSTAAYKACIVQGIRVALANDCDHVVLTTGRRSERFAQNLLKLPEEAFIQMGDYIGFAVRACAKKGVRRLTLCTMIGKLCKIAAGNLQTHVSNSRLDHDFLATLAREEGLPPDVVETIKTGNTARHFAEIVMERGKTALFSRICSLAAQNLSELAERKVKIECILIDFNGGILGRSSLSDDPHYRSQQ